MPSNGTVDSEGGNTTGLIDEIQVEDYKTRNHCVFSVYRGSRNWKRLEPRKGSNAPAWVECPPRGLSHPADEEDEYWLNTIWKNSEDYSRVERFPREGDQFSVPRLDLLTWEDIPRYDPARVAKTRWLIESFLAERGIQLVFGERGSFKSTLLLFAAKAVAKGEEFLGMKTRRRRVLYLDYENPANVIKARSNDFGLSLPDNPFLAIWDRFGRYALPRPGDSALEILVKTCLSGTGRGPWIIFDSWSSLLKIGEGGEFTGQIAPIYLHLRELADLGATITVLDHSRKYERGTLYGGQDKEAKVDSIHNLLPYENRTRPNNVIVRVESWLKRSAPKGEGTFAFEVLSEQDRRGEWHIRDLVRVEDPEIEEERMNTELMQQLIRTNPNAGQEKLARLAAEQGLPRDQAITLLKGGIAKHWDRKTLGHNKYRYTVK